MDVRRVIMGLDERNSQGKEQEGEEYLDHWLSEARAEGDWKSELSILSELLGQVRHTMNREKAMTVIDETLRMLQDHHLEQSATGATILTNVATTMKCFGRTEESLPLFEQAERVFAKTLQKGDYRFAGLHNNMALTCAELGETDRAQDYFYQALEELEGIEESWCDRAVTYCNLAELTGNPHYLDKAADCLKTAKKDGYYDFTVSKCRELLGERIS